MHFASRPSASISCTASFSSRGPLLAGAGDLLKPDLIAPGQDILAAVAPPGNAGQDFALYSGTSMSSPHVAGLAALLKDLHPTWTPMMIKSALMTTAYDVLDSTTTSGRIFRQGAGHVQPNKAADPGLVFNSTACRCKVETINPTTGEYRIVLQGTLDVTGVGNGPNFNG